MTLRQLELFLALAGTPHLGQVASAVGLTPSAVSMSIKNLEETLETRLFDRINQKIILNEDGRLFLGRVEHLIMALKESEKIFRDEHLHGEIRMGVSSSIANYILPPMIYRFMEKYEGVSFKMETGNTREVVDLIENGRVDMGFIEGECHSVGIEKEVFGTDELLVVTGDRALARKKSYPMEELLGKRWILREKGSGTRGVFMRHLGDHAKQLNIFMELDETGGVKSVLSNKDTLACLSRFSVRNELESGLLYRLNIEGLTFTRSLYTIRHRNKYISSLLKEFISFTRHCEGFFEG
ncbi:MAG: LysR family transcriptional regulator [Desulfobacteraceae bacterium]|nr:LysR family transcriptional regulator [Desulfobacteraceae bacterium]